MAKSTSSMKNFEKSLLRLEQIVNQLEEDENSLEELLKLYEEGSKLAKELQSNLDSASQRLSQLTETREAEDE
ncbi:MAG: exodeoxyribonuclease VII small subunit [Firmicutes bacterium]|nr:exodeoxyribonuclease VII small subunit [Bacillota bacterium]MDD4263593.1 exodeoxyribonuclease VII small subunit [Bacillota bacterium]MDD4693912.1 exodeoxyribonuclease VII small subunit [Bacillota bacterium]